ncbi:alkane 1-monooxygenase [Pseudomonas sp. F1_0610]|uniref:alkane 1-monooxygenase n=1 Tax=Pseudomonas sp. F1_0610 TaxID=3114284 RepID=UPI0039C14F04
MTKINTMENQQQEKWKDKNRYLWLFGPMLPISILIMCYLFSLYPNNTWILSYGAFMLYVIVPVLDIILGQDTNNPPESAVPQLENDLYYRLIVYSYVPLQLLTTVFCIYLAIQPSTTVAQIILLTLTAGGINGIGIVVGHELGHKTRLFDQWMAKIGLSTCVYGHFFVEHNWGHHVNVATPEDPASSRLGESFWEFLPRTVLGSLKSAQHIETKRLKRLGKSKWSLSNHNLQTWIISAILFAAITIWLGWFALALLIAQAIFGFSLLEVVNYLEHYGLLREKNPRTGRYVPCNPQHSWNSNNILTNLFIYQLQRHSDHHANPHRSYQALRHFDESPQLPSGYATMILVAYIPWLWFKVMDKRVAAHYNYDLTRAHIHERKRAYYLNSPLHRANQSQGNNSVPSIL